MRRAQFYSSRAWLCNLTTSFKLIEKQKEKREKRGSKQVGWQEWLGLGRERGGERERARERAIERERESERENERARERTSVCVRARERERERERESERERERERQHAVLRDVPVRAQVQELLRET